MNQWKLKNYRSLNSFVKIVKSFNKKESNIIFIRHFTVREFSTDQMSSPCNQMQPRSAVLSFPIVKVWPPRHQIRSPPVQNASADRSIATAGSSNAIPLCCYSILKNFKVIFCRFRYFSNCHNCISLWVYISVVIRGRKCTKFIQIFTLYM